MDKEARLVELFRNLRKQSPHFHFAVVTEITGNTCSVKMGELELTEVKLLATRQKDNEDGDRFLIVPKVGSMVIIADDHEVCLRMPFVVAMDDVEKIIYKHKDTSIEIDGEKGKITINGGENGGLTITPELKDQLDKMSARLDKVIDVVINEVQNAALHPNTTWPATAMTYFEPLQKESFDNIEDEKVTH